MSWLSKLLEDAGKKPAALARHLGVKPPRVSEMIKGTRRMQPREIPLAAKFFGIAVERVAALAAGEADPGESFILPIQTEALPAPDAPLPPMRTEMPKDVPVYGTVVGGSGQGSLFDFELNGTVVDYVRRPPRIAGRADVFAAYVAGGSMAPWREPGQLIYAESVKSPKPLDYVLVELKPRDGGTLAIGLEVSNVTSPADQEPAET